MDLAFSLSERWTEAGEADGIGGIVEFRTDVFDAGSVEVLVSRLQQVLDAMTADPQRSVSSVDLLDDAERIRLGEFGHRAALGQPSGEVLSMTGLLGTWVSRIPDAVAVTRRGLVADVRASWMRSRSAGRRCSPVAVSGRADVCGLVLSRSLEAVVATVAVLKSGAAYVPVDPGLPAERLRIRSCRCCAGVGDHLGRVRGSAGRFRRPGPRVADLDTSPNPLRTPSCRCRGPATWRM